MRPLTAADPHSIGGHRLLARLGSGGMGVVYLARSPSGAQVALKVIRAEFAAEPDFRARFRREAEAAARVRHACLLAVTGSDAGAKEPWLATEFVPGPSLGEAVARMGPLPELSVRGLGARLTDALAALHAAGLVHRDVKPANVLLALDGPRLIDFGIARSSGATALTETGTVIGTPGYLAPEQARADGDVGPWSDVFALGCVLAHAATGRPPFGTGTVAGVLYRTVHEEADLEGAPAGLAAVLAGCLAKDRGGRSDAAALYRALGGAAAGDWPLPGLPRLVAERAGRALAPPDRETAITRAADGDAPATDGNAPAAAGRTRRRLLVLGAATVVLAAGGATAARLATGRAGTGSGADAGALPRRSVGLHLDLTGRGAAYGQAQEHGAQTAAALFNSRRDRPFDLVLRPLDDGGDPARAREVAAEFADDDSVLAVLGPSTTASVTAVADRYNAARLVMATVSVDESLPSLSAAPAVFQLRPDRRSLPIALIRYLTTVRPTPRTAVVRDDASGRPSYDLALSVQVSPPARGTVTVHPVAATSDDFRPAVAAAIAAGARGIVYAGTSPERGARCAQALRDAGFTGTRVATEPVLEAAFLDAAGPAAEDWVFSTTWVDPAAVPAAAGFVRAYRARYGKGPGRWAAEAYDALLFVTQGLTELGGDRAERGALVRRLRTLTHRGVAKTVAFSSQTGVFDGADGLYLSRVRGGRPEFLGRFDRVKPHSPTSGAAGA